MSRSRSIIFGFCRLVLGIMLLSGEVLAQDSPRTTIALAEGWRFKLGEDITGAEQANFPDRDWEIVSVPHSWNRVGYYLTDEALHVNRPQSINRTQGTGWYRLTFAAPANLSGRDVWLQFDAASRLAEVWLNGVKLGDHRGGFSRFRLNATAAIKPDQPNLLVVRVNNTVPAPGTETADIIPLSGDFFVHGGLYRGVSLIVTDKVAFDMADFGGPGVYATTAQADAAKASIAVSNRLRNGAQQNFKGTLVTQLADDQGHEVARSEAKIEIAAGETVKLRQSLTLARPHLWQGTRDPYLYRLISELHAANGGVVDRLVQNYGIRTIRIDPERGFFLNGQHIPLHGVSRHQDREGRGWALSAADEDEDVALIREIGANTIRLAHYQQSEHMNELADRAGLILWDEIPLVSKWTLRPDQDRETAGLAANARQQLTEMIRQNFNRAAVAVWGIANEVDFGIPVGTDFSLDKLGPAPDPTPLLTELSGLAKELDPSRPSTLATCCEGSLERPGAKPPIVAELTDVTGANRYYGWYYGLAADMGPAYDRLHQAHPRTPMAVSEYGAGAALSQGTDDPRGGFPDVRGRVQPQEYQSYVHELSWQAISQRPYLWASWVWNMFDFATTVRREGDSMDINTKGLVSYDRRLRKDAFYFYKANWSSAPVVYVTGRHYPERDYAVTDIRVYSNAQVTTLAVNGVALAPQTSCPQRVCVWPQVTLAPGDNQIVASGSFGGQSVSDQITWTLGEQAAKRIWIDSGALMGSDGKTGRYGSDVYFTGGRATNLFAAKNPMTPATVQKIDGTEDQLQAATYRHGRFSYDIPVPNGTYRVQLGFVEPSFDKPGQRVFNVTANGDEVLTGLDLVAIAGGPLREVERHFDCKIGDGKLRLAFLPVTDEAVLSTIQISPEP